ncbi:MAG: hypothetical protein AAF610_08075 [Pseudomonadota bacterium]
MIFTRRQWVLAGALALAACGDTPTEDSEANSGGLTEEEMALELPASEKPVSDTDAPASTDESATEPDEDQPVVAYTDDTQIQIEALAQGGYSDPQGRLVVDVIEGDNAFMAILVETPAGAPVMGATASMWMKGTSEVVASSQAKPIPSDLYGLIDVGIRGGKMGKDVLTVTVGDQTTEVILNVLSIEAARQPALPELDDGIPWTELMAANVQYQGGGLVTEFIDTVAARDGKTVRISGFMTPLEADSKQKWFLLTSSPPHCYFDIPGGPAGTVEVLAPDGIEVAYEPIVLEGRFETLENGQGAIYKLHDAKQISP